MNPDLGPNGEEDALTLVVASPVLVGFAEVARLNRPVDGAHDLAERDLLGRPGENVPAANPPFGPDDSGAFQGEQDLLQVGLGKTGPFRDVSNRSRIRLSVVERQRQKCPAGVVPPGRNLHRHMVALGWCRDLD